MIRKILISSLLIFSLGTTFRADIPGLGIFKKAEPPAFLSKIDTKKKQLESLQSKFEDFQKRKAEGVRFTQVRITDIATALEEIENQLKSLSKDSSEKFLTAKKTKLNARRHNLVNIQDAWTQTEEAFQGHIKLVEQIIQKIESDKYKHSSDQPIAFELKDFREIKGKLGSLESKIKSEIENKETTLRQKKAKEDSLTALQKQIDKIKSDQKVLLENHSDGNDASEMGIKERSELLNLELLFSKEKEELTKINIEKLDITANIKTDEIMLLEMQLSDLRETDAQIESRLVINQSDVNQARSEYEEENRQAIDEINKLTIIKSAKKEEQNRVKAELAELESTLSVIKEKGEEESVYGRASFALLNKLTSHLSSLMASLNLYYAKEDLLQKKVNLKKLQADIIEIHHKVRTEGERGELEKWLSDFSRVIKNEKDDIKSLEEKQKEINNSLTESQQKIDETKATIEKAKGESGTVFKNEAKLLTDTVMALREAVGFQEKSIKNLQEHTLVISEIIRGKKELISQAESMLKWLEAQKEFEIWKRTSGAVPLEDMFQSFVYAEKFLKTFVWRIPSLLNFRSIKETLTHFSFQDFVGVGFLIIILLSILFSLNPALIYMQNALKRGAEKYSKGILYVLFNVFFAITKTIKKYNNIFAIWLFVQLDIYFNFKQYFGQFGEFIFYTDNTNLVVCFYMFSIALLVFLSLKFVEEFIKLNRSLGHTIFDEALEGGHILLLKMVLYISAIILPFRQAFLLSVPNLPQLPKVLFAAYTIILQGALIAFALIHKDGVLERIRVSSDFMLWIKDILAANYRPALLFLFCLLALSNPYVGYFNLAYQLLYAVPFSALFVYGLFYYHASIRQISAPWFFAEEDGDYVDKFDHAKTYYAIFVLLTFMLFSVIAFLLLAKVWGVTDAWELAVDLLQDKWTVEIGENNSKIGIIQFIIFVLFIVGGIVASTLLEKLVLEKMCDILRIDFGLRNTITSISHYLIIYFAIVFGLIAIKLGAYIWWVSTLAVAGVALATQSFIADFIAGFLILIERPVEIGSFIKTEETLGTVYKISPRTITIRNARHEMIIIPNKEFLSKPIKSFTYGKSYVGFDLEIRVSYKNTPDRVKRILMRLVQENHRILKNPSPVYRLEDLQDNGYAFLIRCFVSVRRVREKWEIAGELRTSIINEFKQQDVDIPFSQQVVYLRKDSAGELSQLVDTFSDDVEKEKE